MTQEHPFAQYVRILGKGKNGSRALTEEEAQETMRMILAGEVEPIQLGAFLMLMRVKEETGAEVAGFVRAIRETITLPELDRPVDLDWSSYAGKRRHHPWFLLAALTLAANGVRIFMQGTTGHTEGRIYTEDTLRELGLPVCASMEQAKTELEARNFAYMPLAVMVPKLQEVIEYRPLLGLRSPVHTVGRMINPFAAPYSMQSIFHRGYLGIHQDACEILGQPYMVVIKGDGGEVERNPDMVCEARVIHDGKAGSEEWPAMFKQRHVNEEELNNADLKTLWEGNLDHEYGEAAVIGTLAIALKLMGKAADQEAAMDAAREMWAARDKRWPA
ncbi:glycosyl transferase family protein [Endothiovibrio diazotrophicus]